MFEEDKFLLEELKVTRNLQDKTVEGYKYAIISYTEYCEQSMCSLIDEAEQEEIQGVRWKMRRLRKRLLGFRAYLMEKYDYASTVNIRFKLILTIYRHFEIELQPLPPISTRNKEKEFVMYENLPTMDIIRKAVAVSDLKMKAIILFIASSGTDRAGTTNLTVNDFLIATKEYHNTDDIQEALLRLDESEDIIPTWKLRRQKTNKEYFTFSTPESTQAIVNYLSNTSRRLKGSSLLFDITPNYLTSRLGDLNARLQLGKVGKYNRFRCHMLRKFHASQLATGINALTRTEIDALQGRSKENVHKSYYMDNPLDLKKKYARNIDKVTIFSTKKTISSESKEYQELLDKYERLQADIKEAARQEVKNILQELGYKL